MNTKKTRNDCQVCQKEQIAWWAASLNLTDGSEFIHKHCVEYQVWLNSQVGCKFMLCAILSKIQCCTIKYVKWYWGNNWAEIGGTEHQNASSTAWDQALQNEKQVLKHLTGCQFIKRCKQYNANEKNPSSSHMGRWCGDWKRVCGKY